MKIITERSVLLGVEFAMQLKVSSGFAKVLIATVALFQLSSLAAIAAPAGFAEGIQAYNGRNYRLALANFQRAAQTAPKDCAVHYYLGLSYQGMNQYTLAKQEYQWVASSGDIPALRSRAAAALSNLSRYSPSHQGSPMPSRANGAGRAIASNYRSSGRFQVLDFYTDWCGPCKRFAPIFEQTAKDMRDVEFRRLNAEDQSNAALVQKYRINAYPTVIYADGNGNELDRSHGFSSEEDFANRIRSVQGR